MQKSWRAVEIIVRLHLIFSPVCIPHQPATALARQARIIFALTALKNRVRYRTALSTAVAQKIAFSLMHCHLRENFSGESGI